MDRARIWPPPRILQQMTAAPRTGKILEAPPLGFSHYLLSSIFTAFLMIHLWASLAPIPTAAAVKINDKVSHYLAFSWLGIILVWSLISCSLRWPERIRLQKIWLWAALALSAQTRPRQTPPREARVQELRP